jgi:UDP-2,4-diacetamido-2,4,6-trideoxy-beta-L-altropyranose hydrolase
MNQVTTALQGKKIWFRADASVQIGSGHVMRCVTLAKQCRMQGAEVTFFCRQAEGSLFEFITNQGFRLHSLPSLTDISVETPQEMLEYAANHSTPDWLIVDHYGIDYTWEASLRPYAGSLLVIDDLANRKHDCDGLLDQNLQPAMEHRYKGLVPETCKLFLGPGYALLRDEFQAERMRLRARDGRVQRILVSFGGSDPTGESRKAFDVLADWPNPPFHVDLVAGSSNPDAAWLAAQAKEVSHIDVHPFTNDMAILMAQADLALGAGGTTTWERLYMGLPAGVVIVADNQRTMTEETARRELCWNLGDSASVTQESIRIWLEARMMDSGQLLEMSRKALSAMPSIADGTLSPLIRFLKGE